MIRIAIADARDDRVVGAAATLASMGSVRPVLIDPDPAVPLPAGVEGVTLEGDVDPLTFLAEYVRAGHADAGLAGSLSSSASVIRAGIRALGANGLVSGCFLMQHEGAMTTYADCSVVPDPTAEQLADIAEAAADHHRRITGAVPLVGMLSFSTAGSAEHPSVHKVRTATEILRRRRPSLTVEGEMQFDVAVDVGVGERKMPGSQVAGRANVLIFPTLEAGNIAYKVAERVGRARALGSFVLNLTKPWVDLSRGISERDLVDTALLLAGVHPAYPAVSSDRHQKSARSTAQR